MSQYFESCPVCKSSKYEVINPSTSAFYMWSCGSVYLNICLECGCVYLPNAFLDKARKKYKERKKNDQTRT